MREQGYGKVILLTTDAARIPTPAESMIGAAGAVVMSLTRSLAQELAGFRHPRQRDCHHAHHRHARP